MYFLLTDFTVTPNYVSRDAQHANELEAFQWTLVLSCVMVLLIWCLNYITHHPLCVSFCHMSHPHLCLVLQKLFFVVQCILLIFCVVSCFLMRFILWLKKIAAFVHFFFYCLYLPVSLKILHSEFCLCTWQHSLFPLSFCLVCRSSTSWNTFLF